jgi:hypothetical protein
MLDDELFSTRPNLQGGQPVDCSPKSHYQHTPTMNSSISPYLNELGRSGPFNEVHEVVRVFTVYAEDSRVLVRVTLSRYYFPGGITHHVDYERQDENGVWHDADYGQVVNGAECEETSIKVAIGFIQRAHNL